MIEIQNTEILITLIRAGDAILKIYQTDDFETEIKQDNSPVTLADKKSSDLIASALNTLFPTIPVISEENSIPSFDERKSWKSYFLVDPLDGTKEFIGKNGEFCINLALIENNHPIWGWIYIPVQGKGWYCKKGEGIFEFDSELKINPLLKSNANNDKLKIVISRSFFNQREAEIINKIKKKYSAEIIQLGSSLKQIAILKNDADLYIKAGPCSEWDTAPGQLMIEEAGGAVLTFDNLEKMVYNKPVLINPNFVMIGPAFNSPRFISFIKKVIDN